MIDIDFSLNAEDLSPNIDDLFTVGRKSVQLLRKHWDPSKGSPVFTLKGKYTSKGWTEWTQGFLFGNAILLFDALDDQKYLDYGRNKTVEFMAPHLSHTGVHDHGFNNISSYGNLLRLMEEGRIPRNDWEAHFYRLALKVSGAVQASRWTELPEELGYVYSFNGAHSLFSDTIRSMRVLLLADRLGHSLMGEQDEEISLLRRALQHAETTARFNVFFGTGRDAYDVRGRVAHESIFNVESGSYRCPSSQQGYSPFSTWTRGLAWILAGYPEDLEFFRQLESAEAGKTNAGKAKTAPTGKMASLHLPYYPGFYALEARFLQVSRTVADYYIESSPSDGIPYWDTAAPGLVKLGNYSERPADPYNDFEPVDSSAAAISAQGLLRLGDYLSQKGQTSEGKKYFQAGLTIARRLFSDPYLARADDHQGILMHSVYHRPNGWDFIGEGTKIPSGESCLWGDYHALELGLYIKRLAEGSPRLNFYAI